MNARNLKKNIILHHCKTKLDLFYFSFPLLSKGRDLRYDTYLIYESLNRDMVLAVQIALYLKAIVLDYLCVNTCCDCLTVNLSFSRIFYLYCLSKQLV